MDPDVISQEIEMFLREFPRALVLEDGQVIFALGMARYSLSTEHGRCLLHLWSGERNAVRWVLDSERKRGRLKLTVQRFGRARPSTLEVWPSNLQGVTTARRRARAAYQQLLLRVMQREFPGYSVAKVSSAPDLERSFGPIYTRALLRRGATAIAVVGVNREESQSSIDGTLTCGILWLDHCRELERRAYVEGLTLFLPAGTSAVVRERMAHLNNHLAKWTLYELDERDSSLAEMDCFDRGNLETRLVHRPDPDSTRARFAQSIARIRAHAPDAEVVILSGGTISFRIRGLEFARAVAKPDAGSFRHEEEIVFGVGASETVLNEQNEPGLIRLVKALGQRRADGNRNDPLWRMAPERWLESLVLQNLNALDARLDPSVAYPQTPALSWADRGTIDVLCSTREGRIVLLELKAEDDTHLPLQGVDYWSRVVWHQQRQEFQQFGYFPGRILSDQKPLLLLVAPALQVHPATDTLLRHLSPHIDYELIGIDQRWRERLRVVFRKRREHLMAANTGA